MKDSCYVLFTLDWNFSPHNLLLGGTRSLSWALGNGLVLLLHPSSPHTQIYPCWNIPCVLRHFSHVQLFAILWTVALQAPQSMGFSRQEYWHGLLCPPSGDLLHPGIEFSSLASRGIFFTTEPLGKPKISSPPGIIVSIPPAIPVGLQHKLSYPSCLMLLFSLEHFTLLWRISQFLYLEDTKMTSRERKNKRKKCKWYLKREVKIKAINSGGRPLRLKSKLCLFLAVWAGTDS